jgi:hypothetical protein
MTVGTDVPLGEESELYDVEWLTTSNVLKRTVTVGRGGALPAILVPEFPEYGPTIDDNNIIATADGAGVYGNSPIMESGGWVEATLELTAAFQSCFMGLFLQSELGNPTLGATKFYDLRFSNINVGGVTTFEVYVNNVLKYTSESFDGLTIARVRIMVIGSEVYLFWDYLGSGSVPLYISPLPAPLPMTPRWTMVNAGKATNIYVRADEPSVIYTPAQQIEDGFTPNVSTIRTKVYQRSSIVGRGPARTKDF